MCAIWIKAIKSTGLIHGAAKDGFSAGISDPERIVAEVGNSSAVTAVKSEYGDEPNFRCGSIEGIIEGKLMGRRGRYLDGPDSNGVDA